MKIALIGCGKAKRPYPCEAQALYTGGLFKQCKAVAMRFDAWGILSAKHGLLMPEDVVAPYESALSAMPKQARRDWATRTRQQIVKRWGDGDFVCYAAAAYAEALRGLRCEFPMQGMSLYARMHHLATLPKP